MALSPVEEFKCPRCSVPLQVTRTAHGVFWGCGKCGGRAITVELLRRTFTPESINPLWLHAIRNEGVSSCACPSCGNNMTEVSLADEGSVRVDVCKLCHFVWFDMAETDSLRAQIHPRPREVTRKRAEADASPYSGWVKVAEYLNGNPPGWR